MKKTAIIVAMLLGLGCAHAPGARADQPATTLRVRNEAYLDMTVFVIRGGERLRLGIATGGATTVMTIPARIIFGMTPLRFQADPIGASRQPVSEEVTVSPGDEVSIMIPPS